MFRPITAHPGLYRAEGAGVLGVQKFGGVNTYAELPASAYNSSRRSGVSAVRTLSIPAST